MADNWLRQYGYNAVELPRRDLSPADVLYREGRGDFDRKVGRLSELFGGVGGLPDATSGEPTGNLTRTVEKKVELSLGLKILAGLIGGDNASRLGADTSVSRASTLKVSYEGVIQDSVSVLALQTWLESVHVDASRQAMIWLNDDRLAAVTATLRSARLSVAAETSTGGKVDVSIPEIQGIISGEVKVEASSSSSSTVTFVGAEPVAFGFQAFQMVYEGNVSFGLEEVKGIEPTDFADQAWVNHDEVARLDEAEPAQA